MGLALLGVECLNIAVVRRHRHHIALVPGIVGNLTYIAADGRSGFQLGVLIGGMANDVAVGKVRDDKVIAFVHGLLHFFDYGGQTQLRFLVEGNPLG